MIIKFGYYDDEDFGLTAFPEIKFSELEIEKNKKKNRYLEKKKKDYKKGYILPVCIFILMMVMLFYGVNSVTNATAQKEQESLKNAVVQSVF